MQGTEDSPKLPETIGEWSEAIHQCAVDKGWWSDGVSNRNFGEVCALIHSEVSEALEEHRNGRAPTEIYEVPGKPGKPEGIPIELADVVIRILDYCGAAGIDLQAAMEQKYAYNLTRPYRHGGKAA